MPHYQHVLNMTPLILQSTHLSESTGVMSILGGAPNGRDVGLFMISSSGVRDLSP